MHQSINFDNQQETKAFIVDVQILKFKMLHPFYQFNNKKKNFEFQNISKSSTHTVYLKELSIRKFKIYKFQFEQIKGLIFDLILFEFKKVKN